MILHIEKATYSYGYGQKAFEDLNFSLKKGEVLCVCGANGSGKSTLLRVMAGVLDLSEGSIVSEKNLLDLCSILFQEPDLQLLGQNVWEEILLSSPNPSKEEKEKAQNLLACFKLWEKREESIDSLSFGQKRKLCIATALMQEPEVLLLDEPTAGLDYPAQKQIKEIFLDNKKKAISQCIVCHDIEFFVDFADSLLLLEEGKQVYYGNVEEGLGYIKEHENIGIRLPYQKW